MINIDVKHFNFNDMDCTMAFEEKHGVPTQGYQSQCKSTLRMVNIDVKHILISTIWTAPWLLRRNTEYPRIPESM
jgi:hypothetical protein